MSPTGARNPAEPDSSKAGAARGSGLVRTVLGDIDPATLGIVDAHDHLFLSSAALPGVELDNEDAASAEAQTFADAGGRAVVQWSPAGTARRLDALRRVSSETGVKIIAATGRHLKAHYPPGHPIAQLGVDELIEHFVTDIQARECGLIKVGTSYWTLGSFDRAHVDAAAQAATLTGAPVAVHLERGTAAPDVLAAFTGHGLAPGRIILGHLGRFPDPGYVRAALDSGAFACFDAPSLGNHSTDWRTPELVQQLVYAGYGSQLLLGADTTNQASQPARGGAPGTSNFLAWVQAFIAPRISPDDLEQILVANPARVLTLQ